jgi:carbamoyl-phosphate synthase large subunit
MKELKILITGAGAPGIAGTIHSVRNNPDRRKVSIVGTDINEHVVGRYFCDEFYKIPRATSTEYLDTLLSLCLDKKVDVLIPQNTAELLILSDNKEKFEGIGTKILVSNKMAITKANDKFNLMETARLCGVPTTNYCLCSDFESLKEGITRIGNGDEVVVKPPMSNGSRGVRIVSNNRDRKSDFYNEKPNSLYITLEELHETLGDEFPELMVMEYLPGDEFTVDIFRSDSAFVAIPRKREVIRSGITFGASLTNDQNLIKYSRLLSEACDLTLCFGFQFKLNKQGVPMLLESNPRVQGTMVMSTFAGANVIYASIKDLLGEAIPPFNIDWNTRLLRYWGAVGIHNDGYTRV